MHLEKVRTVYKPDAWPLRITAFDANGAPRSTEHMEVRARCGFGYCCVVVVVVVVAAAAAVFVCVFVWSHLF